MGFAETKGTEEKKEYAHYETETEDYLECKWEYENGLWGV